LFAQKTFLMKNIFMITLQFKDEIATVLYRFKILIYLKTKPNTLMLYIG